jgi:hypothetical protein
MLSHGGSRLNASKPEANPKTSCPKKTQKIDIPSSGFRSEGLQCFACVFLSSQEGAPNAIISTLDENRVRKKTLLQIESPLKQARPSGCLVGAKYIKNSREFSFFQRSHLSEGIPPKKREWDEGRTVNGFLKQARGSGSRRARQKRFPRQLEWSFNHLFQPKHLTSLYKR